MTPRGTHQTLEQTLADLNQWYVGWANYYSLTQYPSQLNKIEAHIRRRLRARLVSQQKRKQHLFRNLVKRGVPVKQELRLPLTRLSWRTQDEHGPPKAITAS